MSINFKVGLERTPRGVGVVVESTVGDRTSNVSLDPNTAEWMAESLLLTAKCARQAMGVKDGKKPSEEGC